MDEKEKLRFKPNILLSLGQGADNVHVLALRSQRSYPTTHDYVSGDSKRIDLELLTSLLIDGLGMTREQMLDLRLGDLFEFRESK